MAALFEEGENVTIISAPEYLLSGLPVDDQKALNDAVGTPMKFVGNDAYGFAELAFIDHNGILRFIWLKPDDVVRLPNP